MKKQLQTFSPAVPAISTFRPQHNRVKAHPSCGSAGTPCRLSSVRVVLLIRMHGGGPGVHSIFRRGIWCTMGAPSWRGSFGPHTDHIQNSLAPGRRRETDGHCKWTVVRRCRDGLTGNKKEAKRNQTGLAVQWKQLIIDLIIVKFMKVGCTRVQTMDPFRQVMVVDRSKPITEVQ